MVVSAVGGVTDALLRGAEQAAAGGSVVPALARFHSVHREILDALRPELGAARAAEAETDLGALDRELENLLRGFGLLRECPPTALALLSSLGERASCALVFRLLAARGLDARLLDPKALIRTCRLRRCPPRPTGRPPARPSPPCGRSPRRWPSCPASSAATPTAASISWGAAARTTPAPSPPGPSTPSCWRSGPTSTASTAPTRGWSPAPPCSPR